MKKICIVTATRAEYGLLKPLMNAINSHNDFVLQLLVTGAHLSPEFGNTYELIEKEGFYINEKVEMLLSADTGSSIVKSMGLGMIGYADAFIRLKPDAIIILGDRYEMLSVASSASAMKIPIIHLHGGEITEGAYDDSFRHAITKLSHLHFASTENHKERIIQLGEQPQHVFNVGAIGIDNIASLQLLSKEELERDLDIRFAKYNYQVTFHPETLADLSAEEQFKVLLQAIKNQKESFFVFTKSNADTNGRVINRMIDEFVTENPRIAKSFTSLGTLKFLSLLKQSHAIIGNSSSGIIEAPSLHTPTINIGDRQKGRMQAKTIINCAVDQLQIQEAIARTQDETFVESIKSYQNPYGRGDTTNKIIKVIESTDFSKLLIKKFHDNKL